jgi:L-seryl-tRNA(Ser) seleniumtransferase
MNDILRQIPKVDEMLSRPVFSGFEGHLLLSAVKQILAELRQNILNGNCPSVPPMEDLENHVLMIIKKSNTPGLQRVINATGVILHTNLGRAPLAQEALDAITETAKGYSNLEYDVINATRGSRYTPVENLLKQLTNAEAALVVNNNAAAILLVLLALARNRCVIISRGELVEIGGSFRIPDVMVQSGCYLAEVGTTNKTHLKDYENALKTTESAGAILRVHASNFKMSGFVSRPSLKELTALAKTNHIPFIEDLGSGALVPLHNQPTVADSILAGVDIVTFSGDKLLGGPQAGIIVGRKDLMDKIKSHPLTRALRIDKLSLAALEATLRLYINPETATEKIPALKMLTATETTLHDKARHLQTQLNAGEVISLPSQAGGGAMPEENLPSAALALTHPDYSALEIERHFRENTIPVIGRISQGKFLLDVRTIDESDFAAIALCYQTLIKP